jgi:hypothetical protein
MSVGAVGRSRRRACSRTPGLHQIAAPGGDFRADGLSGGIYQVGLLASDSEYARACDAEIRSLSGAADAGTSMAAPHVAGCALLHARGITNPAAIEAAIRKLPSISGLGEDDEMRLRPGGCQGGARGRVAK